MITIVLIAALSGLIAGIKLGQWSRRPLVRPREPWIQMQLPSDIEREMRRSSRPSSSRLRSNFEAARELKVRQ